MALMNMLISICVQHNLQQQIYTQMSFSGHRAPQNLYLFFKQPLKAFAVIFLFSTKFLHHFLFLLLFVYIGTVFDVSVRDLIVEVGERKYFCERCQYWEKAARDLES